MNKRKNTIGFSDIIKATSLIDVLKNTGLKATKSRQEILGVFYNNKKPMTAEEVSSKVNMDIATVYRNLEAFNKIRLINKLDFRGKSSFYEINDAHHHHIMCKKCNMIEEVDSCELGTLTPYSKNFSFVNEHLLEFFGICKSCAKS